MKKFHFKRSDGREPGTWKPAGAPYKANVVCPVCSIQAHLKDHEISDDGEITPSLVCPGPGCTFHVFAVLDDF
jgi:hypothetical protein